MTQGRAYSSDGRGRNSAYRGVRDLPPLVSAAVDLATKAGFDNSCAPEQGRLLSVLARGRTGGRVGETGTGCGVGLAWMVDATDPATTFVSIEVDEGRAAASAGLFASHPQVSVLHGDWTGLADTALSTCSCSTAAARARIQWRTRRSILPPGGSRSAA